MSLITWSDNLSVNVKEIDEQNQELIKLINSLHDAMKVGKANEVLLEIINGLLDYTSFHFETEEKYFDKFEYLESKLHKQEHKGFVEKVLEFKKDCENGKIILSIQVKNFLSDWLKTHNKGSDKRYSKFFNDNGLK